MLEVVSQPAVKRPKIQRDLSQRGLGLVGEFENANPDAVPPSGKAVDVSYLFPAMGDSYENAAWKTQVVADPAAAERALRLAAVKLGYGVVIRMEAAYDDDGVLLEDTRVYFKAVVKRTRTSAKSAKSAEGETSQGE